MDGLSELRAHRVPLAFLCAGSVQPPKVPVATGGPEALLGQAAHEVLRSLAETGQVAWGEVHATAERYGVSDEELSMICGCAQRLWPAIQNSFVDALTEVALSHPIAPSLMLTGHADAISIQGPAARVLDWKSGRKDHDYSQQMRAYAALALSEDQELTTATATIVWLRDAAIENYTMDRDAARAWLADLAEHVLGWDGVYHPGRHCLHCPRSHECEASNAMIRRDVAAFADRSLAERLETDLATMQPDAILDMLRKADLVAYLAGRVRAAIKVHVTHNGDVVGSGARLTIDTSQRRELLPLEAWPVLEEVGLTSTELVACMELYISRVESLVAKRAGRGKGAAAVRQLAAKLEEAKAIALKETHSLKEKRT